MGTRGTITFIFNGKKITVYNHWDSYPASLGIKLAIELKILLSNITVEEIIEKFNTVKIFNYDSIPSDEEIEKIHTYSNLSVSTKSINDVYCLLRKTQGSIIKILDARYVINHNGSEDFDYVIDFDSKIFSWNNESFKIMFEKLEDFIKDMSY